MILTPFFELKFMLKDKTLKSLQSEKFVSVPSLTSLMKISLGLIFFTILSTALVYAEVFSTDGVSRDDDLKFRILENAFLYDSSKYFENTMISSNPGTTVVIINDDTVSHSFVSGVSNGNADGKINFNNFLLCEFDPNNSQTVSNQDDNNSCDFNKDNRIITEKISPGDSIFISIEDIGTYRLIDPDYPWMEITVYSFPNPETESTVSTPTISTSTPTQSSSVNKLTQNISVYVNGISFNIPYDSSGMTVTDIESDSESMSLIFSVDVTDHTGKLNVKFDRSFFDSVYDGVDDYFFILADGDETISQETQTSSQSRTLSISIPSGTEELEVIGSVFNSSKVVETPVVETPVVETPVVETPVVETPVVETPSESSSNNQCGAGTLLLGNECVLDERCGPGTILENNVCVLDSGTSTSNSSPSTTKETIISFSIAFGIAGVIGIILALIAKAHKKKN